MTDIAAMDEGLKGDIASSCAARSDFYRFLAGIFLYELTDAQNRDRRRDALPPGRRGNR